MQDPRSDQTGPATMGSQAGDLDLVTSELRRRIAGIGLAIAELREETGRLRAAADARYPAVAVLDRPVRVGHPETAEALVDVAVDAHATVGTASAAPTVAVVPEPCPPWQALQPVVETQEAAGAAAAAPVVAEPRSPWQGSGPVVVEPAAPGGEDLTMAWVPAPVRAPEEVATDVEPPSADQAWGAMDDTSAAAFEAFFSAEVEPEPAQRWLLSD